MKKSNLFLLIAWMLSFSVFGQTKTVSLKITQQTSFPTGGMGQQGLVTGNATLNSILTSNAVVNYYPKYPAAYRSDAPSSFQVFKYYYLLEVPVNNLSALLSTLQNSQTIGVSEVRPTPEVKLTYQPSDYNTLLAQDVNANWYLNKIKIKDAWDISKGSADIRIAIIDVGYDLNHQDFSGGKVVFSEFPFYFDNSHGTYVASLAAGKTDDGIGISSVGFNSSLLLYGMGNYGNTMLEAALDGADVINLSFVSLGYEPDVQSAINTISELGVFIVAGAGNGLKRNSNGQLDGYNPELELYPASYENVFSVTGVHSDDLHKAPSTPIATPQLDVFQYNDKVDLSAPGYHIMHAMPGGTYDQGDGTSFSAPIVAGVVALMKAVNPCLSNAEVEQILKSSADPIYIGDNTRYAGKLGAGRLNAHQAVLMAKNWGNLVVSTSLTVNQPTNYKSIVVKPGGSLTILNTSIGILPGGAIKVEGGGKLTVNNSVIKALPTRCYPTAYKWNGIEVNGSPKEEQEVWKQGVVMIVNSTIQDAMNAISTVALDANRNIVWSKTGGGIIIATNSIFRNNGRHLEFLSYHRPLRGGAEPNNRSSFSNCQFFVDDGTVLTTGNMVMITLFDVKGVRFSGCTFQNDYNFTSNIRGKGILALDAAIIVENDKYNPGDRSVFENLECGIDATYSPYSGKVLIVNNSDFIADKFGISLKEGLSSSIYQNTFDHRKSTFNLNTNKSQVGLQSVHASGFQYAENSFIADLPTYADNTFARNYLGTEIWESDKFSGASPYLDATYHLNGHVNIKYGSQAVLKNTLLKVTCNSYSGYYIGMTLANLPGEQEDNYPKFGSCVNDRKDRNNSFDRFVLMAPGGGWYRLSDIEGVNRPDGVQFSRENYVVKSSIPLRPSQTYTNVSHIIINKCNGQIVDIEECIPMPKPSDISIGWDPQDKVNQFVQLKQSIPNYPSIDDSNKNTYIKLAALRTDIIYNYNNLLLLNSEEPDRNYLDEYILFLESDNNLESKKMLVATCYSHGLYARANSYLGSIAGLSPSDVRFIAYYRVLIDLKLQDKSIFQMSNSQIGIIRGLTSENDMVSSSAKGIMTLVFGDNYERMPDAPILENDLNNGDGVAGGTSNDSSNYSLLIYPNPSVQSSNPNFNVEFEIKRTFQAASLVMLNGIGEPIYESTIPSSGNIITNGSRSIPTNILTPGLFVTQLIVDGVVVSHKMFNLVP
jgi:subtilisin family serine protease